MKLLESRKPNSGFTAKMESFFCSIVSAKHCRGLIPLFRGGTSRNRRIPAPQTNQEERILLKIILTEAANGIVKAIRVTTLSPSFTEKLHNAIREQAAGEELSRAEFVARSLAVYKNQTPAELADKAIVRTYGGE